MGRVLLRFSFVCISFRFRYIAGFDESLPHITMTYCFKDILLDYKINQTNKPVDLESLDELKSYEHRNSNLIVVGGSVHQCLSKAKTVMEIYRYSRLCPLQERFHMVFCAASLLVSTCCMWRSRNWLCSLFAYQSDCTS